MNKIFHEWNDDLVIDGFVQGCNICSAEMLEIPDLL